MEYYQKVRCLYDVCGVFGRKLLQMFPQYCKAVLYNKAKRSIGDENVFDKRKLNKGKPPKVTIHNKRRILRAVSNLQRTVGLFTLKCVQVESGMMHVCNRNIWNILHKAVYKYQKTRKKGFLEKVICKSVSSFVEK